MKIVIKVDESSLYLSQHLEKLTIAVAELLKEGHRIILVNGTDVADANAPFKKNRQMREEASHNESLVAWLGRAGLAAFSLYAGDSNIIRLRKRETSKNNGRGFVVEAAHVDPRWLDIISNNGGIPVIVNAGPGLNLQHGYLDADQMAGACAVSWSADALIFLTNAEGLRSADGSIVRWLQAEKILELLQTSAVDREVLSKLNVCRDALQLGVHRARLLPLSQIDSLALFYFARIDFGTEVILAV